MGESMSVAKSSFELALLTKSKSHCLAFHAICSPNEFSQVIEGLPVQEDAPPSSVLSVLDSEVKAERWVNPKLQQQHQADQDAAAASAAAFQQVDHSSSTMSSHTILPAQQTLTVTLLSDAVHSWQPGNVCSKMYD